MCVGTCKKTNLFKKRFKGRVFFANVFFPPAVGWENELGSPGRVAGAGDAPRGKGDVRRYW